ncbi:MAG TPA: AAA family ATPase [Nannocystis sp.]
MPPENNDFAADRARVTQLSVSNFRSLGRDVVLRLDPLTVLVGPNGSGKSNVVDALRFLADCMEKGLGGAINDRSGIEACRRWNRSSGGAPYVVKLGVTVALPGGGATYDIELTGSAIEEYSVKSELARVLSGGQEHVLHVVQGKLEHAPDGLRPSVDAQNLALPLVGGDTRFQPLFSVLRNIAIYSIYPNTLREPQKYSASKPMARHGENWVSILKDQLESWKPQLVAALNKLTGDIDDVKVAPAAGYLVARFRRTIEKKHSRATKWFDAYQESDGTLRVAGIVTALLQEPPIPVIGIEEPELTIHPGAIALLYDHLIQASRRSQVIVTTHSPELLDLVSEDAIRVVSRSAERGTTVAPLAPSQREAVRAGLMTLGEVLRTEGLQQELPLSPAGDED